MFCLVRAAYSKIKLLLSEGINASVKNAIVNMAMLTHFFL